jgi:cephalosporin-C deacetylase-like acetyl esterase
MLTPERGGFAIESKEYSARIGADGNLSALRVNGVDFLAASDQGPAASFFVGKPIKLSKVAKVGTTTIEAKDDNTYAIRYTFSEAFLTLTLRHSNRAGAAYVFTASPAVAYVRSRVAGLEGTAVAPADLAWGDVRLLAATGEYLDCSGGSSVWGRKIGRQVWERASLASDKEYTLTLWVGRDKPPKPTLSQLTRLTVTPATPNHLVPGGVPVELQARLENNASVDVEAEVLLRVESSQGDEVYKGRRPIRCQAHEAVTLTWDAIKPPAPGFYTVVASAKVDVGNPQESRVTFGYDVTAIAPSAVKPPDFDAYWAAITRQAQAAPVTLRLVEAPRCCTPTVTVYRIEIEADKRKVYGWLSIPKFPGRYPGLLYIPAESVSYVSPNEALAGFGFAVMTLEPLGQDIDKFSPLVEKGFTAATDKDRIGLREAMVAYLRAISAFRDKELAGKVDPDRIAVTGVGLGGSIAMLLGAMDERVQAVAADVPPFCSIELGKDKPGWPYAKAIPALRMAKPKDRDAILQTLRYYDVANVTDKLACPVLLSAGILDPYARPGTVYGVYNRLPGPRDLRLYIAGHEGGGMAHWEEKMRWFVRVLGPPGAVLPDAPAAGDGG